MKRIYYYLELNQTAPLRLGNGDGEETDSDLRLDGRGLPYIPGTSLAGVMRSRMSEEAAKKVFGYIDIQESIRNMDYEPEPNRLIVSDAVLAPDADKDEVMITSRDGVGLDDWGQAIRGAKYDFQVVETDQSYYAVLEWFGNEKEEEVEIDKLIEPLLIGMVSENVSFGARTT